MKVLLVNGSPHEHGSTDAALSIAAKTLNKNGIETEIFWVGTDAVHSCMGCAACKKLGKCVKDDIVNVLAEKAKDFDGFLFGSPVHYAAASGAMTAIMDRLFYSAGASFRGKPGAAIAVCRRGGASATLDQLNKYFPICGMPLVPSQYWNMVHGAKAEDIEKDEEGTQTIRTTANNLAWLLKCIEAGKAAGITYPEQEAKIRTNFVR